ncbi:hypothetical protein C7960_2054 [Methanohalophilus euhalobius]|jgi:hypothetical protein|uniref:UPF0182 protein C7960_2054 n=2 Tax=Methanohalophilus TaxID=2175 RepID=A0A285EX81_9EURY|nr:MAG: hypothetical protein A8273_41 [Methanohalophilus sp. 2-GBenrich]RXG34558.1 hypothetical protein CI957_611 [Methanohalophilus sp. WG1-DM]TCL12779.1 hypothetical protein C7960_2054 [Methanohalophilus euhalobius]SNY03629.1 hypothetical protein SAMN06295989_102107 [Methanohalophilus euhalobius]
MGFIMKDMKIIFLLILALFLGISPLVGIYTDYLWFDMIGYTSVFTTILQWKLIAIIPGFIIAFLFLYINAKFARDSIDKILTEKNITSEKVDSQIILVSIVAVSFIFGLIFSGNWKTILLYFNSTSFGLEDPILMNDIGFYVFQLPFLHMIRGVFLGLTILSLILVLALYFYRLEPLFSSDKIEIEDSEEPYFLNQSIDLKQIMDKLPTKVLVHISAILAFLFALIAFGFFLERYEILFSQQGVVAGAGYTAVNVSLPIFTILTVLSVLTSIALLANVKLKNIKIPFVAIALIALFIVASSFVPGVYQQFKVEPTEIQLEEPYLEYNINYTRTAYGLSDIEEKPFKANMNLTSSELEDNSEVIDNIRIWDRRALEQTYKQLQQIRTYYTFNDVDTDRYHVEDGYKQYMISARELDTSRLSPEAKTWVNEKLVYTHGYGMVMNPVSTKTEDGRPELVLQDIPPRGEFEVDSPGIYYGEINRDYNIVNTGKDEFDYPKQGQNVFTQYEGKSGILLDSFVKQLIFAYTFSEPNFILSQYIDDESRLLYRQQIEDRAQEIAPFLEYDNDPYPVIHEGKVYWIMDAYTTANKYPYSETYYGAQFNGINYIRNSVKVVVDAYDGTVDFYMIEDEPVVNTYSKIFPDLFKSFDEMPQGLQKHIRYPKNFFKVQMDLYENYHMKSAQEFYNKEDSWQIPREVYRGSSIEMEPYYMVTKLPDDGGLEYVLLQPFTPRNRENMIAWIAARCDKPNYGQLKHYELPKGELVYGPTQIESRIDQDPDISQQLTLWGQSGSRVIRGNLLVVPIGNSILYSEPLFISAEQSEIPELRRVVVSSGQRVVMGEDLKESLQMLVEGRVDREEGTDQPEVSQTSRELAQKALDHYNQAREYLKEGNWTGYGEEIDQMEDVLNQLSQSLAEDNSTATE